MFAISYKVTNNSSVPIRISNILYTIYGSAGGALNDIVLSTNSYQSAWIPVGSYATGELDGNSVSYIPYSFSFSVYAQGSDGGSNSGTYTGIFNVIAKRTMVLDSIGIPMNRE